MKDIIAQRKLVKYFYVFAVLFNVVVPFILLINTISKSSGDAKMGYVVISYYAVFILLVYAIYFAVPDLKRRWEKIVSFLLPSIVLAVALIKFEVFVLFGLNLILNSVFLTIWYFRKLKKKK